MSDNRSTSRTRDVRPRRFPQHFRIPIHSGALLFVGGAIAHRAATYISRRADAKTQEFQRSDELELEARRLLRAGEKKFGLAVDCDERQLTYLKDSRPRRSHGMRREETMNET